MHAAEQVPPAVGHDRFNLEEQCAYRLLMVQKQVYVYIQRFYANAAQARVNDRDSRRNADKIHMDNTTATGLGEVGAEEQ